MKTRALGILVLAASLTFCSPLGIEGASCTTPPGYTESPKDELSPAHLEPIESVGANPDIKTTTYGLALSSDIDTRTKNIIIALPDTGEKRAEGSNVIAMSPEQWEGVGKGKSVCAFISQGSEIGEGRPYNYRERAFK